MFKFWKVFLSVLIVQAFASCAKDVSLDYRDAWVGTYNCIRYSYQHPYNNPPTYDTSAIDLTFLKDESTIDGIIFNNDTLHISNSGIYSNSENANHVFKQIIFRNDSVFYYYSFYSPGGTSTSTIIGKKQ